MTELLNLFQAGSGASSPASRSESAPPKLVPGIDGFTYY
jgi:hypothetical protein